MRVCASACVLAVYNKAQAQIISNREFKLWTILQATESRVATFHAQTCAISHQSLSRQATKSKSLCVCVCVCACRCMPAYNYSLRASAVKEKKLTQAIGTH